MSFQPPRQPGPRMMARPKGPSPAAPRAPRLRWGWLEWVIVSQTILAALLFVPGISAIRTPVRVSAYLVAPLAWAVILVRGRTRPGNRSFPARPWLIFCTVWLLLEIFHPNTYSMTTGLAQVALYVSILSPAFWVATSLESSRQIGRLMAILFLCNALSTVLGIAQVYKPNIFLPPYIPAMHNAYNGEDLIYQTSDGRRLLRPCGLTDTPGGVFIAGQATALLGLCWALRPMAVWKRLACLVLAFLGVAVIYYTQIRTAIVMLAICLVALTFMFFLQRNLRAAAMLSGGGVIMAVGSLLWVARSAGNVIWERFVGTLINKNAGQLFHQSRGAFVQGALEDTLFKYPLGYGLGWWGMIQATFGNRDRPSPIWVEVMIPGWIYDGGIPLLVGYMGALGVAFYSSVRIALTTRDRELAFWAAVIVALNLSSLATTMSFITFLSPMGLQFWILAAALHAADIRSRAMPPSPASPGAHLRARPR